MKFLSAPEANWRAFSFRLSFCIFWDVHLKTLKPTYQWLISGKLKVAYYLGGGFNYFLFSPLLGEMIQFDSYFSMGWKKPPTSNTYRPFFNGYLWVIFPQESLENTWKSMHPMVVMVGNYWAKKKMGRLSSSWRRGEHPGSLWHSTSEWTHIWMTQVKNPVHAYVYT